MVEQKIKINLKAITRECGLTFDTPEEALDRLQDNIEWMLKRLKLYEESAHTRFPMAYVKLVDALSIVQAIETED
ncbi:MAG: hypothetical protein IKU30_04850 [Clostridia bacterium]|nr:hypothetical protein [Clostridia bacterium]